MLLNIIIISVSYALLLLWCITAFFSSQSLTELGVFSQHAMSIAYFLQLFISCWICLEIKPDITFRKRYARALIYFSVPLPAIIFLMLLSEMNLLGFLRTEFISLILLTIIVFISHILILVPLSIRSRTLGTALSQLLLVAFSWTYYIR